MRAGGGEGDVVVLVVSTARMARRRNLGVLRGDWETVSRYFEGRYG